MILDYRFGPTTSWNKWTAMQISISYILLSDLYIYIHILNVGLHPSHNTRRRRFQHLGCFVGATKSWTDITLTSSSYKRNSCWLESTYETVPKVLPRTCSLFMLFGPSVPWPSESLFTACLNQWFPVHSNKSHTCREHFGVCQGMYLSSFQKISLYRPIAAWPFFI